MANFSRLAALCILLLSSANIALGKIRGTQQQQDDRNIAITSFDGDGVSTTSRQLMNHFKMKRHEKKHGHMNGHGNHGKNGNGNRGKNGQNGKNGNHGKNGNGHAAKGAPHEAEEFEVEVEVVEDDRDQLHDHDAHEHDEHEHDDEEMDEHGDGTDHHHHPHTHEEDGEMTHHPDDDYYAPAKKGGNHFKKGHKGKKGSGKYKGGGGGSGKYKGGGGGSGKYKGGGGGSGEYKGGGKNKYSKSASYGKDKYQKGGYEKGGGKYSKSVKGYEKGGGKYSKSYKYKGESDYEYVSKKSRTGKSYHGGYDKSKNKLKKSGDGYYSTDEPTLVPSGTEIEPTLVEVPVTFYFAFDEIAERRRLDGHITSYEPTPEEIETLKSSIHEYAVGLFDYLHESNPDTFYSVTATLDRVVIEPDDPFPLQVDVTFHILYNEAPEDAPAPEEVAAILEGAFSTDEFKYFYLWGNDNIWNNVSDVKVEANLDEDTAQEPEMTGPVVHVMATMVYDFGIDPTADATEADYDLLVKLTEDFFSDLFTDYYKEETGTHFEELSMERHATTFDLESTPPVIIDFSYKAEFEPDCVVPSSEELFKLMAQTMFDDYIRLYLEPSESIWSTVDRVSLLEYSIPEGGPSPDSPEGPAMEPETSEGLIAPASSNLLAGTMVHAFMPDTATRPTKEDYDKLEMATNFFFIETLTDAFANNSDTKFIMSSSEIRSTSFNETLVGEELQVDYITTTLFEGVPVDDSEVFELLKNGNFDSYIMEYLWQEGEPWNKINGVMYEPREQIAP